MTKQEIRRRRGEIFCLWMSVFSVMVGVVLTSTTSPDQPADIWFISGIISGFLGSVTAFGFVLYISFSSEYHYQETVSSKKETAQPENQEKEKRESASPKNSENEKLEHPQNNYQQHKTADKTDLVELDEMRQAEYQEVQDILNKATKMLEEFRFIAENLEAERK
ncbi:uncharacterized protein [Parasteatoda tepidariorum]|uniref:uncharacterized protein isoform X2 n=1 Tax=Parasteatoda tepidariorum TaxID=114398 RepID=UPI00077FD8C0|nr:uncharacterized protein LOC107445278 isoform X2 [Parasteatoda tepidariorum]